MSATTSYGNWTNFEPFSVSMVDSVSVALGEFAEDFDVDAIVSEYRAAINAALPEGVTLCGDELYGPYNRDGLEDIDYAAINERVDFWAIAARHEA